MGPVAQDIQDSLASTMAGLDRTQFEIDAYRALYPENGLFQLKMDRIQTELSATRRRTLETYASASTITI